LTYLDPPPAPAPVEVVRDIGGYVKDYREQTEIYRRENRDVRLHECRSACTLALSLPNVCVYPDSLIKFHQAYDETTRIVDEGVSQDLFQSYPPAVRARLGTLTRQYQSLSGAELIELGIRDCREKRTILIAQAASPQERGTAIGQAMSEIVAKLLTPASLVASPSASLSASPIASLSASPSVPKPRAVEMASLPQPVIPPPPSKPAELRAGGSSKLAMAAPLDISPLKLMPGALPLLPSHFSAYAPLKPFQVKMIESHLR
jgi:hypothetical protein